MRRIIGILTASLTVFLFSCQKNEIVVIQDDLNDQALKSAEIAAADDNLELALSEVEYESDFYSGIENLLWFKHKAGIKWEWNKDFRYKAGKCPGVKFNSKTDNYPRTITLDYGDGTTLSHGRELKGKIIIEISAPPFVSGATRTVTYVDFVVDTITINGISKVVYTGDGKTTAKNTYCEDITFNNINGKEVVWKGQKVRDWKEGLETPLKQTDDVFEITGSVLAAITGGETYKKEITSPLIKKGYCRYIVKGVIKLTIGANIYSTLDYGSGDCNDIAILTKGGETIEIELSKHLFHKKGK